MIISDKCINLVRSFEGFRAKPYLCPAGVPTIGYGSTREIDGTPITLKHPPITEAIANSMMRYSLASFSDSVTRYVLVDLNQNQFDALVDFAYNCGPQNLKTSTMLKLINKEDFAGASKQFALWVHDEGAVSAGLVRRREAERVLFCTEVTS